MLTLWRKWIAYPLGWLILMVAFLAGVGFVSGLGGTDPAMESFHGRYHAQSTGDQVRVQVREEISVRLKNERGIIRDLITTYGDSHLDISGITVEDEEGTPVNFRERRDRRTGDIEIRIGSDSYRMTSLETYVIGYTINKAMVGTRESQALYFNTNGTEWNNGFKEFSARLDVDDSLAAHLNGSLDCYQGGAGSQGRCEVLQSGNTFTVALPEGLQARENVTLDIGFDADTITNPLPPVKARSHGWVGIAILVGIGALALALALIARWFVRDLRHGETGVVTQFTPPEEMEPLVAADFLGRPERGAAAHLAWLVLSGHADITTSSERTGTPPGPDVDRLSASQRAELDEDLRLRWHRDELPGRLRTITELLFGDPDTYLRLSEFRRTSNLLKAQHYRDLAVQDLGLRRDSTLGPWVLWIGYLSLIGYGAYQVWIGLDGLSWWFLLGGVVGTMLLLLAVHLAPSHGRLTKPGREMRRYLMGLERFVTTSEANRIAWLQNAETAPREDDRIHLYERLLPWAIIFGAERSWVQLLGTMYNQFPELHTGLPAILDVADNRWWQQDREFYARADMRSRASTWSSRSDIGGGSLASGWNYVTTSVVNNVAGRGSSNTSTRSSGRGRRGGSSRRSSGGGTGGGGGRRW
ncbi:DUF2207 family protein [Tessaracoccus sp.]